MVTENLVDPTARSLPHISLLCVFEEEYTPASCLLWGHLINLPLLYKYKFSIHLLLVD